MRKYGDPLVCRFPYAVGLSLAEKLEAFSDRSDGPDACWPWTRGKDSFGYGTVAVPSGERDGGKGQERAHRAAWRVAHGTAIPAGLEVLHSCDNPACVNPSHLRVGTHAENMREMSARSRAAAGERNALCKLTDAEVVEVRRMRDAGMLNREIAAHFDLSVSYVSRLTSGSRRG